jgi:dienelactone hydrolase
LTPGPTNETIGLAMRAHRARTTIARLVLCSATVLVPLAAAVGAPGCSDDKGADPAASPAPTPTPTASQSADAGPGPCADTKKALAFPVPSWHTGERLAPVDGDAATELVRSSRSSWIPLFPLVDGWPIRPTIVLPLDAVPSGCTGLKPDRIRFFAPPSPGATPLELPVSAVGSLAPEAPNLVVQPMDPLPAGARDVILVVKTGAIECAGAGGGATDASADGAAGSGSPRALPACGADGKPDPAYAAAMASLGDKTDVVLALPFRVATTPTMHAKLWARLLAQPALVVDKAEPRTLDSFAEKAPPAEVAALLSPQAASGILALPEYRDASGNWQLDADGGPKVAGTTKPGFVVALPAKGTAPFPVVLFQHGGSQNKADFFKLAGPLAEAGFAFVSIDLPSHGDRHPTGTGGDMDILDFKNPTKTRDNLRQASADHLAVLTGFAALNAALAPVLGVPTALDPTRQMYMGLSLGGITGSMTFAAGQSLKAAALFVGAGGYPEVLVKGMFSLYVADVLTRPVEEKATILGLAEALLDGADPLAYGTRLEDRTQPPRPVIFEQAVDDPVIPMPSSDQWARAFGADLATPSHHPVAGMKDLALPASGNFSFSPGGPTATRLLVQNPMKEVPTSDRHGGLIVQAYAQKQVTHCFAKVLSSGACELIDTGYFQH